MREPLAGLSAVQRKSEPQPIDQTGKRNAWMHDLMPPNLEERPENGREVAFTFRRWQPVTFSLSHHAADAIEAAPLDFHVIDGYSIRDLMMIAYQQGVENTRRTLLRFEAK